MAENTGKLHAVLAVLPSLKGVASKIARETKAVFGGKAHLFDGHLKTYSPLSEGGDTLPEDRSPMATTVGEKLAHFVEIASPALDAAFQVEKTNQSATADIIVGGFVLTGVPATFLMQLDKQLIALREVYDDIPTRDPKYVWEEDVDAGRGVFRAIHDEIVNRNVEKIVPIELAPATKEHKAQVKEGKESIKVGEWTTKRQTGKISPAQKYELLSRIDQLQRAVKQALSRANETPHSTDTIAKEFFGYINGDLPLTR